jgi:hypothetical protein
VPKVNANISEHFVKLIVVGFAKGHGKPSDVVLAANVVLFYSSSRAADNARRLHTFPARCHDSSPNEE